MSTQEPPWGGAEATPDPAPDRTGAWRPDRNPADPGAETLGGRETVESNDELDGDVSRGEVEQ